MMWHHGFPGPSPEEKARLVSVAEEKYEKSTTRGAIFAVTALGAMAIRFATTGDLPIEGDPTAATIVFDAAFVTSTIGCGVNFAKQQIALREKYSLEGKSPYTGEEL